MPAALRDVPRLLIVSHERRHGVSAAQERVEHGRADVTGGAGDENKAHTEMGLWLRAYGLGLRAYGTDTGESAIWIDVSAARTESCTALMVVSRDYRKLRVFTLADALVPAVYQASNQLPPAERSSPHNFSALARLSVPTWTRAQPMLPRASPWCKTRGSRPPRMDAYLP